MLKVLTISLLMFVFLTAAANAGYINPGSGSDIFQIFLSALSGFFMLFKKIFKTFFGFLNKGKNDSNTKYD